MLCNKRRN